MVTRAVPASAPAACATPRDRPRGAGRRVRGAIGWSNLGGLDTARLLWEGETLWNRSIIGAYTVDGFGDPFLPTTSLVVNSRTGAITTSTGAPQARYVALQTRGFPVVPAGIVLARSPNRKLELLRVAMPMRAAWVVSGVSSDGWLGLYQPATVRLYALRGAAGRCATVGITLSLSEIVSSAQAVTVSTSGVARQMSIAPGRTQTVDTRVCVVMQLLGTAQSKTSPDQSGAGPAQLTGRTRSVTIVAPHDHPLRRPASGQRIDHPGPNLATPSSAVAARTPGAVAAAPRRATQVRTAEAASRPPAPGCAQVMSLSAGAPVRVGKGAGAILADAGVVWVARAQAGTVTRITAGGRSVVDLGGAPVSLAAGFGQVWVALRDGNRVAALDPEHAQPEPRDTPASPGERRRGACGDVGPESRRCRLCIR